MTVPDTKLTGVLVIAIAVVGYLLVMFPLMRRPKHLGWRWALAFAGFILLAIALFSAASTAGLACTAHCFPWGN